MLHAESVFALRAEAWVDELFSETDEAGHPAMTTLRRAALQRLLDGRQRVPEPWSGTAPTDDDLPVMPRRMGPLDAVRQRIKLPAAPDVLLRLQAAVKNPNVSACDIADIVSSCPKLAASLLKVVNSPLYRPATTVETLSHAVAFIGSRRLSILAIGSVFKGMFEDGQAAVIDMQRFWRHSVACAVLSYNLAIMAGRPEPERFYVAGLLHDLGKLALHGKDPGAAELAMALQLGRGIPCEEAERRVFGTDHAEFGGLIFEHWKLPGVAVLAAQGHHSPGRARMSDAAAVVHIADVIAKALGYGGDSREKVSPFAEGAWERLGLPPTAVSDSATSLDEHIEAFLGA